MLVYLGELTVRIARATFTRKPRSQGWSPLCDILTVNLHMVIRLQRGVLGLGGRRRWIPPSYTGKRFRRLVSLSSPVSDCCICCTPICHVIVTKFD